MTLEVECGFYSLLAIENDIFDGLRLENSFDSYFLIALLPFTEIISKTCNAMNLLFGNIL